MDLYSAGLTLKYIFLGGKKDETADQRAETKVDEEDEPLPFPKDKDGYMLVVSLLNTHLSFCTDKST